MKEKLIELFGEIKYEEIVKYQSNLTYGKIKTSILFDNNNVEIINITHFELPTLLYEADKMRVGYETVGFTITGDYYWLPINVEYVDEDKKYDELYLITQKNIFVLKHASLIKKTKKLYFVESQLIY